MKRRNFLKTGTAVGLSGMVLGSSLFARVKDTGRPNVILLMADDMGYGDVSYYGNEYAVTPNLETMASSGIRFDRFYSGGPVCSPTRGSCLTGRHPHRYGITYANRGRMEPEELTLAEALKQAGYRTGHFGKWHLGTLTTEMVDGNRAAPGRTREFSPPWENGFDVCFSTESKVPTYNPGVCPEDWMDYETCEDGVWLSRYWREDGSYETENLEGDDSRVMMDRAIPFIRKAANENVPFLAVIWFHTPHKPIVADPDFIDMHKHHDLSALYSSISAMDDQIGRLTKVLKELGIYENTMQWFCSDNGPNRRGEDGIRTAGLAGKKNTLYEGGVRVPGILVWPEAVSEARVTSVPASTSDYFPTIISALGLSPEGSVEPIDGVDLMPLLRGEMTDRPRPLGFQDRRGNLTLTDNQYKLHRYEQDGNTIVELYDLLEDPEEQHDLAGQFPDIVSEMSDVVLSWQRSCAGSAEGEDYVSTRSKGWRRANRSKFYFPRYAPRGEKRLNLRGRRLEKTSVPSVQVKKTGKKSKKNITFQR